MKTFKRYHYLDALRGIAILLVVLAHTGMYGLNTGLPSWFILATSVDIGPRGVQLFYVVSAFTLCMSYANRQDQEKHFVRNFYIRRFFRIAPLFYLSIVFYVIFEAFLFHNNFSAGNIMSTFLFLNGFSPFWINNIVFGGWSIAVETSFYALFPFLFFFMKKIRTSIFITFFALILMQFLRTYLLTLPSIRDFPDMQTFTFQFFPSQLPVFLTGMLTFTLLHAKKNKQDKRFIKISAMVLLLTFLFQLSFGYKIIAGHYIYGFIFAFLLFFLSKNPVKIFVNPVTAYFGKISFSLYLCHTAVLYILRSIKLIDLFPNLPYVNFFTRFSILLFVSSIIASILYYQVEKRGIILGKKIIDRYEKKPTTASSILK